MTLEILICTLDEGINNIPAMLLPQRKGIGYIVSWQHSDGKEIALPDELRRDDVRICDLTGRGVSRNRNNCIKNATADVCLIGDDDCRYTHERLQQVIDTFANNPEIDIATFRFEGEGSTKFYPKDSFSLSKFPKGYYVSSIEIAFLRKSIQNKIWFNENFGLGTQVFHCGEEHIFIQDALSHGLTCKFFPITIVKEKDSTICIRRDIERGTLMAHGAMLHLYQPKTKYLRMIIKACRLWHNRDVPFFKALRHMNDGIKYIKSHPEMM
ncbi:MAG: glycosyltransferase [Muribaculaceae bacterium]|nr:glycosyltransferase [Muribaculaceae bacterium]